MEKIVFDSWENLSWKTLFEMIVNKGENNLKKYIDSWNYNWIWITAMRMPSFEISWDKSDEVWKKIREYCEENFEPYESDIESFVIEDNLDIKNILNWIDEDLQKSIRPILNEVNTILNFESLTKLDVFNRYNKRIEELYKKQDINNLDENLKDFIKNWYEKVWDRVFEILFPKK